MGVLHELPEVWGTGMGVLQNFQKFGVRLWECYRTHRSLGYGYASITELAEVWGTGMGVLQNFQKFGVRVWEYYRTSRSLGYGYGSVTELTEVPGIVARACRTRRCSGRVQKKCCSCTRTPGIVARGVHNSGHGYQFPTEHAEVPGTSIKVLQNFQTLLSVYNRGCQPTVARDLCYSDRTKTLTIRNTWFPDRRQIRMFPSNRVEFDSI